MDVPAHDVGSYRDLMVVLTVAAIAVPVLQRFMVSPILGYLLSGAVLGPYGLGALSGVIPGLDWVTVDDAANLAVPAELGVVFLLFIVGLELSLQRLITMRRLVLGLGFLQIALCGLVIAYISVLIGSPAPQAAIIGFSLALSSTAIVVELLAQQQRLSSATGRASFSILLSQDLAVVPLILFVGILGAGNQGSIIAGLAQAIVQAAAVIGLMVAAGLLVLRPLFRLVGSSENTEVFVAAALLVVVGSGLATAGAGLSMGLGAFTAGLLIAETEYRRAIEATIEPFKGLLLGVFFFTAGMKINLLWLLTDPLPLLAAIAGLVAVKAGIVVGLMRFLGFGLPAAVKTGLLIGPGGEFAFIVIGMAALAGIVTAEASAFVMTLAALSMAMIPLFDYAGRWLTGRLEPVPAPDPMLALLPPPEKQPKAIVIGHGRVGRLVSDMLDVHGVEHVVTERIPGVVSEARREGRPVYFGDGKNTQFLEHCGLKHAKAVIITIHHWSEIDGLVAAVRSLRPDIVIVSRARDAEHARHLYEAGVTDAVPETIEASLQLSEAALVGLGVSTGLVIASIHEKRDEFRATLQKAAAKAGHESRGLRSKRTKPAG
jgi:CPA2 family monovalent cation:H+ antiporter-2